MTKNSISSLKRHAPKNWLTDFCDSLRIFVSIVMVQIIVIIYSFSFLSFELEYLRKLSILTLLAQLTGLVLIILMCKLKSFFNRFDVIIGVLFLVFLVFIITSLLSQVIGYLDIQLTFHLFKSQVAINYLNTKLTISAVIVTLALVRYFYIQDQWLLQEIKLSDAKLIALQARIKPHFLFNSLNSIASLISIDTQQAETAISDFSELMRRTFTHQGKNIAINEELKWVKQYLSIEKLRMGERLKFQITCDEKLYDEKIPVLCIQPLVENAVIHGIQHLENGGNILIDIFKKKENIIIIVTNPFVEHTMTQSNGMALNNIKQRLELQYGNKASINITENAGQYKIKLGIPL